MLKNAMKHSNIYKSFKGKHWICLLALLSAGMCFGQGSQAVEIPYTTRDRELILEIKLRIEAHEKAMKEKLEAYQKASDDRFDVLNSRLDFLQNLSLAILAAIMASIVAIAAYLVWTQKRERQLARETVEVKQNQQFSDTQIEMIVKKVIERLEASDNVFKN